MTNTIVEDIGAPLLLSEHFSHQEWAGFCVEVFNLTSSEVDILSMLYRRDGVCFHEELVRKVGIPFQNGRERMVIASHMKRLRQKLNAHSIEIHQKKRLGYIVPDKGKHIINRKLDKWRLGQQSLVPVTLPDQFLHLSPMEVKVLSVLVGSPFIYSRQHIIDQVYGLGSGITERMVDTHIKRMRAKLAVYHVQINGFYGLGYQLPAKDQIKVRQLVRAWKCTSKEIVEHGPIALRSIDAIMAQNEHIEEPFIV